MKQLMLLPFLFFLGSLQAQSPELYTYAGVVLDAASRPVANARVRVLNSGSETTSNREGAFVLTGVTAGTVEIVFDADGYGTQVMQVQVRQSVNDGRLVFTDRTRQLEPVVVSAQKREELLRSVPVGISVIGAEKINQLRLWNSRDLTAVVPNLYSANPGDGRNVTSVRGITSTSYDPAVTTYIDGVAQFNLDTYIPQLFDVERIEVLRGPQGTLYGRNSMGGVINIISKQPTAGTNGFAEAGLGNYGQQRYTAALRTTLVKNHLFAGAAGLYEKMNGYFTNDFNGQRYDRQHSAAGSYWLKYLSGKRWKADLNVKHLAARNNGAFPLAGSLADATGNPFHLNQNALTQLVDNTFNGSLSVSYSIPGVNLVSQTAFQSNYRYYHSPIDGDFSPIDGITIINNYGKDFNRVKAFTQEFRASSANPQATLRWTGGVYLFTQRSPNKQATHFGEDAALVGSPDINYAVVNTNTFRNRGAAVFGQADYKFSSDWMLTAGIRVDRQHAAARTLGEYLPDGSPEPVFETRPDTSAQRNYSAVSPKLALTYTAMPSSLFFVSYARGFRTGGLTQLAADPAQPPLFGYKPEYSDNIEFGTRNTLFDKRVQLDVNLFYTIVSDVQVPTLVLPEAVTVTRNAGRLESRGVELALDALVIKGLTLNYNFGYTRARYTRLDISQSGSSVDLKGNRQVFTPDYTSMLALQYSLTLDQRSKLSFSIRGEWVAIGETRFDFANQIRQSPYQLFNARAGFSLAGIELMGWMRNLGDKKYISYAYEFGAVHLGDPQTFGVTLRSSF
ncbi:MAG: TonB-dependent receptor [Chitinophagaceae bacterium]|nr:MAG: TonB-dependent receptor [Chitinophagaceae bacterium]